MISNWCKASEANWITDVPESGKKYTAKFRYRQQDNEVTLELLEDGKLNVYYPAGIRAVTPGQAAVFYDGDKMLGGGIIDSIYYKGEFKKVN